MSYVKTLKTMITNQEKKIQEFQAQYDECVRNIHRAQGYKEALKDKLNELPDTTETRSDD